MNVIQMVVRDLCKVPNAPVGGRVESQIILQRDAFNFELVRFCSVACVRVCACILCHALFDYAESTARSL